MRIPRTCTQGHRWEPVNESEAFCPYCGSPAVALQAKQAKHPSPARSTPPPLPAGKTVHLAKGASLVEPVVAAAVAPPVVAAPVAPTPPMVVAPPSTEINWAKVEVAPSLPMAVFTSSEPWQAERVRALAMYCSDGRWGDAFDEFCHRSLLIPHYDRFAIPGGPAWLARLDGDRPDIGQLEYLVRTHELDRIVLITHYGCGYYQEHVKRPAQEYLPAQFADVKKAAASLRDWFKGIKVEGYLAMRHENVLSFHRLDC